MRKRVAAEDQNATGAVRFLFFFVKPGLFTAALTAPSALPQTLPPPGFCTYQSKVGALFPPVGALMV